MKTIILLCFLSFYSHANAQESISLKKYLEVDSAKPLLTGHRGGFYDSFPESSIALFQHTKSNACLSPLMIEVDIRQSKAGTLWVMHDETLERTTNGIGNITESSDEYLQSLFLKNAAGMLSQEKILTLERVLEFAQNNQLFLMLDVKENCWEKVLWAVQKHQMQAQCVFLTFKSENAALLNSLATDLIISVLIKDEKDWKEIQKINITNSKIITYITKDTSHGLLKKLKKWHIPVMTDVSENKSTPVRVFTENFYTNLIKEKRLNILITDYPIEVSKFLCNE
jgi:glycerophosphoryl diester phosphodiesterase